jgi:hypothetical protein
MYKRTVGWKNKRCTKNKWKEGVAAGEQEQQTVSIRRSMFSAFSYTEWCKSQDTLEMKTHMNVFLLTILFLF